MKWFLKISFCSLCLGLLFMATHSWAIAFTKSVAPTKPSSAIKSYHPMASETWYGFPSTTTFPTKIPSTSALALFQNKKSWSDVATLVSGADSCCGIAVSDVNTVYIAYYDEASGGLILLTNESGSWASTVVDGSPNYSKVNDIVLAYRDGKAHILYSVEENPDDERTMTYLQYATNKSGSWEHETVETGDHIDASSHTEFMDLGLVIDSNDVAHITYEDYFHDSNNDSSHYMDSYDLYYATNSSGSWVDTELAGGNASTYYGPSIALDSSDTPYVAYYDTSANSVKLTSLSGSMWSSETVASIALSTTSHALTTLSFDTSNHPHVVYHTGSELDHSKKSSSWKAETIDTTASSTLYSLSSVLTATNQLQVTYCSSSYKMAYLYKTALSWGKAEIGSSCWSSTGSVRGAMAIDNSDYLYLAYSSGSSLEYQSTFIDTDSDGINNTDDSDDDGDGVADASDACPEDASETTDTDGDSTCDGPDTDADNDGLEDSVDASPLVTDADGDGTIDGEDPDYMDSDGDGTADASDPDLLDSDGDGTVDSHDAFDDDPTETKDSDGDGIGDNTDSDDDADGIPDSEDTDTNGGR
jgi:hypothetical protein